MGSVTLEEWRDVVGFEGLYQVSDLGNVKSYDRNMKLSNGKAYKRKGRILAFNIKSGSHPYRRVKLSRGGVCSLLLVSRLVLEAFSRPPEDSEQACHCNGDPSDNRLENLRWDSSKNNNADRWLHGTAPVGEGNSRAKLTEAEVRAIRAHQGPLEDLAVRYGVSRRYLSNIRSRVTWKHVA